MEINFSKPTDEIVAELIKNPDALKELFGNDIYLFIIQPNLATPLNCTSHCATLDWIKLTINTLKDNINLKLEIEQAQEEIATYLSDGFPV